MPFATNPSDGLRIYFEDQGGVGACVVFYTGFLDPLQVAQASGLALGSLGSIPSPQRAGVSEIVAPRSTRRMQTAHSSLLL